MTSSYEGLGQGKVRTKQKRHSKPKEILILCVAR